MLLDDPNRFLEEPEERFWRVEKPKGKTWKWICRSFQFKAQHTGCGGYMTLSNRVKIKRSSVSLFAIWPIIWAYMQIVATTKKLKVQHCAKKIRTKVFRLVIISFKFRPLNLELSVVHDNPTLIPNSARLFRFPFVSYLKVSTFKGKLYSQKLFHQTISTRI